MYKYTHLLVLGIRGNWRKLDGRNGERMEEWNLEFRRVKNVGKEGQRMEGEKRSEKGLERRKGKAKNGRIEVRRV